MRDIAAEMTDELLTGLEKKISAEYAKALEAAEEKWQKYLASFEKQDKIEAQRLADGEITKQQYQAWRTRQIANGKRYEEMRNVIAQDLHKANLRAAKIANQSMADVYAVNANYGTYIVEHGGKISTGFTLYNHDSAEALLKEEWKISPETGRNSFLPKPSAKKQKELAGLKSTNPDVLWNSNKIQSAMFQGILTGEPLTDLAKRLASVAVMDKNQAIRNARTLTTNVQNKGRMDAFDRASKLGVDLVDEWVSVLDGATRHSHRLMHGERRDHNSKEPFSNGCRWPGDPQAPAAEVYSCRCRLISWVKGFEGETVKYNEAMGNMSFEEWQNANAPKNKDVSVDNGSETMYNDTAIASPVFVNKNDKLYEYAKKIHPIDGYEDIVCHGDDLNFEFRDADGKESEVNAVEFAQIIKESKTYNGGDIRLISCNSGAGDGIAAQIIADTLGVSVIAPTEYVFVDSNGKMLVSSDGIKEDGKWKVFYPRTKE